jgi:hypothetical protein
MLQGLVMFGKILVPTHYRLVIIGAKIMPIIDFEEPFNRPCYLSGRRHHPVWENVFFNPRIGRSCRFVDTNGVQQKNTFLL